MASDIKYEIDDKEIQRLLSGLPQALNNKIQRELHRAGAKVVKEVLEMRSPNSDNDRIQSNVVIANGEGVTDVLIGWNKEGGYLAKWIDKGTAIRTTNDDENRCEIQPRNFVESAHEEATPLVNEYLQANYLKLIDRSLKKLLKAQSRKKK